MTPPSVAPSSSDTVPLTAARTIARRGEVHHGVAAAQVGGATERPVRGQPVRTVQLDGVSVVGVYPANE